MSLDPQNGQGFGCSVIFNVLRGWLFWVPQLFQKQSSRSRSGAILYAWGDHTPEPGATTDRTSQLSHSFLLLPVLNPFLDFPGLADVLGSADVAEPVSIRALDGDRQIDPGRCFWLSGPLSSASVFWFWHGFTCWDNHQYRRTG